MKTAIPIGPSALAGPRIAPLIGGRLAAYAELGKPRIAAMALVTVGTGFVLGARGGSDPTTLLLTLIGSGLVACGSSAWNQYLERDRDARMRRTAGRPLPSGRIAPAEARAVGTALTVAGLAILAAGANGLSALVAFATFFLYVFVYTPLKPITTLNTLVGAIPGALPPVIGWAAATGRLGVEAWSLFLVVFLWQFPHFLAIAWLHRADYARGGHVMLPAADPTGALVGRQAVGYALTLVPAGLLPAAIGLAGPWYFAGALALGLVYLASAARFQADVTDGSARRLLRTSILYLPAVLLLLLLNPLPA